MEQVPSKYETTKTRKPRDQLAETANVAPGKMVQMGRQKKNIALNEEKEKPHYQWMLDSTQIAWSTVK